MAKKKAAPKKKATKRAAPKKAAKQSRKQVEKVLRNGPVQRRRPKAQSLPGMENIGQIPSLDRCCRALSDVRGQMSDLRADEAAEMQTALNELKRHNRTTYRQHGVELVRVPGEEKLRVRTSKEGASAETEEDAGDLDPMDAAGAGDDQGDDLGDDVDNGGDEFDQAEA